MWCYDTKLEKVVIGDNGEMDYRCLFSSDPCRFET